RYLRAVFPSASTGPAVVAVSRDAWIAGVRPGMPLAEARSMAQPLSVNSRAVHRQSTQNSTRPAAQNSATPRAANVATTPIVSFHEWVPVSDRDTLAAVAEITRRYAPVVGIDSMPMPDSLLLDITGCGPLFGGEAALAEFLLRDLKLAGWTARIAIADTIAAVWALTHTEHARPEVRRNSRMPASSASRRSASRATDSAGIYDLPIQIIPPEMQQQELSSLPIAASRLPLKDLQILAHLGIRSIGQLFSLPREDLPSRLSAVAVERVHQLLSLTDESIDPLPESNPVAAAWSSEYPANSFDDIRQVLQHLVENVAEQIERRRVACSVLICDLTCASGKKMPLSAGVVKPTQSAELMFEVLSLRLETLPLTESVSAISMAVQTVPIPVSRQRDLFSSTEHIRPQEELATLIARLSNRMGPQSVSTIRIQADPRPEHGIVPDPVIANADSAAHAPQSEHLLQRLTEPDPEACRTIERTLPRPLRLLATPQQIAGREREERPPERISVMGQQRQIVELHGPERIQTAWWTDQPCHRDYFRAITETGGQLWIYRDLPTGFWFLHGLFD
ncbi:MAG: DNA polymerase Y family protein, partial [Fuerstia sp.]|nr:DNA polymerase Y family protein [Fuerstiella sp.]